MSKMLPPSRLLMTTIVVATVTLGIKAAALVGSVPGTGAWWALADESLEAVSTARMVGQARAAQTPAPGPTAAPSSGGKPAAETAAAKRPVSPPLTDVPQSPPAPVADATQEIKLRQSQIEAREQRLAERETALAAVDKHLTERVGELVGIQTRLEVLETDRKAREEANWAGLVKLYEGMKPRDAAGIFNGLDKPVLLEILDRMKAAKASVIIALMEPESARQATLDLANKRTNSTTISN